MSVHRVLVLGTMLVAFGALPLKAQNSSDVLAQVDGDKLTRADLDRQEASRLLQARYKYYEAERDALQQLIDEHLLEKRALSEHISVTQLVDREVNSKVKDPSEDQVEIFYEGTQSTQPYEVMRPKILESIREIRRNKAREAYLKTLRGDSQIVVLLAPPDTQVAVGNAPVRGPRNAPIMLIEFADYECPYCRKVHPGLEKLQADFPSQVAFAFKDYPLPMHAHAEKAAEAARCAAAQGRFWDYHNKLFEEQKLEVPQLKQTAAELKLDTAQFNQCLDSGQAAAAIQSDVQEGNRLGLTGTPSFVMNGHFFSGSVTYDDLRAMVRQELAAGKSSGGSANSASNAPAVNKAQ